MALLHGCFSRFLNCRNRAKGFKYFLIQKRIITASRIYIMAKKRAMTELPTCRGLTMMGSAFFLNWNKVIKAWQEQTSQIALYLHFYKRRKRLKTSFQARKIFRKLCNHVSCSYCLGFKRLRKECTFLCNVIFMMTSQILKLNTQFFVQIKKSLYHFLGKVTFNNVFYC